MAYLIIVPPAGPGIALGSGGGGGSPTGAAGGVLGGFYPNPGFAVDMATQAELDAAVATLQLRSERGVANGYAPLGSTGRVPIANIASGTPDGTKFVRDDGTLAVPPGGGGGSTSAILPFGAPGALTVGAGIDQIPFPSSATIMSVIARARTAPQGAAVVVDVNKNGTTIFTTQANRPSIAATANNSAVKIPDVTTIAVGDYLSVDVDQIGSTLAGADLVVSVRYTA